MEWNELNYNGARAVSGGSAHSRESTKAIGSLQRIWRYNEV